MCGHAATARPAGDAAFNLGLRLCSGKAGRHDLGPKGGTRAPPAHRVGSPARPEQQSAGVSCSAGTAAACPSPPARSHAELGPCPHWAWRVVVRNGGTFGKVCLIGRVKRLCDVFLSRMSQPVAAVTFAQSRGQCPVDGEPWVDAAVSGVSPHLVDRAFRPHPALTGRPQRGPGSHSRASR
ncbi:hypothetical protein MRX96_010495 [Rhipicephalus microplus]